MKKGIASKTTKDSTIEIIGAKEHNLKNIDVHIPKGNIVAITGASGAGKSTLAHGIIAKIAFQRLKRLKGENIPLTAYKPLVDSVNGLPPCIELTQEPLRGQARSTVATYTGLQYLFASLLLHRGEAKSMGGETLEVAKGKLLVQWLLKHHIGKNVVLAKIQTNPAITSTTQIKAAKFYFREPRTEWSEVSLIEARKSFSNYWTVAIPVKNIKLKTESDIAELSSTNDQYLVIVDNKIFIETNINRIAKDQPIPYRKLSRELFSFNSSYADSGQCVTCQGLGEIMSVDEKSIFINSKKSLFNGGLSIPISNGQFVHMGTAGSFLRGLLKTRNISFDTPIEKLPKDLVNIILNGSGAELVPEMRNDKSELKKPKNPFNGLLLEILERSKRTSGSAVKIFSTFVITKQCPKCGGSRYNISARSSNWNGKNLSELLHKLTVNELAELFNKKYSSKNHHDELQYVKPILTILNIYKKLNLGYLQLSRASSTLSGGEAQRLKLGLILALEVRDSLYILDEPSRGLHTRDINQIIEILQSCKINNNTILLVEHQNSFIKNSDYVINLGPEGGSNGGYLISESKTLNTKRNNETLKLSKSSIPVDKFKISVSNLSINNLNDISFKLPAGHVTAVVGVSGAGKSSAILKGLVPAAKMKIDGGKNNRFCKIQLPTEIKFVEIVGQKLASQNRRSIVATTLEMFDDIRNVYSSNIDAQKLNLSSTDFSFNSSGACGVCGGTGLAKDGFGAETDEICPVCNGSRFNSNIHLIKIENFDISELLSVSIDELILLNHPAISRHGMSKLKILSEIKLGHLSLGRSTPTLSAGERQRLALARFVSKIEGQDEKGLLILDEPTCGLSSKDSKIIFDKINSLAKNDKHTIVVLEHKLEFLEHADWIIEFGPGGGPEGGRIIYNGEPVGILNSKTPTADILRYKDQKHTTKRPGVISIKDNSNESWENSAEIFESLALRHDVKDTVDFTPPVRPAITFSSSQISPGTRVGEILNLFSLIESNGKPILSSKIVTYENESRLFNAIEEKEFLFSPVSTEFRNGIAIETDLKNALRKLKSFGFTDLLLNGKKIEIKEVLKRKVSMFEINNCYVICPKEYSRPIKEIALRWSLGVVYLKNNSLLEKHTYKFVLPDSNKIGLDLANKITGNRHSPIARCTQCNGLGAVPTYPLNLIFKDMNESIKSSNCWHPSLEKAIISYGRRGIFPQAVFFKEMEVVDFLRPINEISGAVKVMFEHGIPWRKFLRPKSKRTDRESDYFSWRGIHDYVYLTLPSVTDNVYKNKIKEGAKNIPCPICDSTGMGFEAKLFYIGKNSLQTMWKEKTLLDWYNINSKSKILKDAVALNLGDLKPNDHFDSLENDTKEKLLLVLALTAPLEGLSLISKISRQNKKIFIEMVKKVNMNSVLETN